MPISNDYEVYQTNGTTDNAGSFAYWTDPVYDTSPTATDTNPNMVYSPVPAGPNRALRDPAVTQLGACYKQLNSSVGQFGPYTLTASTTAIESATPGDALFKSVNTRLTSLDNERDALAIKIKNELYAAENSDAPVHGAQGQTAACEAIIG
jgi:hypothetical protein